MLKVRPILILVILPFLIQACRLPVPVTGGPNRPPKAPTISSSTTTVSIGDSVRLNGSSVDPDGDRIKYFWFASSGEFSDPFERSTTWQAPTQQGLYEITLEVNDGRISASSSIMLEVVIEEEGTVFLAGTQFAEEDGASSIRFSEDTLVVPEVGEFEVKTLSKDDVPPLPAGSKAITRLSVKPSGRTFDPPADLRFLLPPDHGFRAGEELEVLQYDDDLGEYLAAGLAEVDEDELFAIGTIAHTTIFVLIERVPITLTLSYSGFENVTYRVEASAKVPELRIDKDGEVNRCFDTDLCTLTPAINRLVRFRSFIYSAVALDNEGKTLAEAFVPMLPDSLVSTLDSTVAKYQINSISVIVAEDRVEGATGIGSYIEMRELELLNVFLVAAGETDFRTIVTTIGNSGTKTLWILDLPDQTAEIILKEVAGQGYALRIVQVNTSSGDVRVYN